MDQRHIYEQTITGKLDSLPLPDLADAIWARVEAQLDIDMPEGDDFPDGGGPLPSTPPVIIGGFGFLILILFELFFYPKENSFNPPANNDVTSPVQSSEQVIIPAVSNPENVTGPPGGQQIIFPQNAGTLADSNVASVINIPVDSSQLFPNTVVQSPTVIIPKAIDSTTKPGKKPRGVSGINDADYKIVPKKDSLP